MPSIKGDSNYNNGIVRAGIKKTNDNVIAQMPDSSAITAQIPNTSVTLNSDVETDTPIINASVSSDDNFVQSSVSVSDTPIITDPQTFGNATTTKKGVARIATLEEVIEGTNNSTIVTPYTLKNSVTSDKYFNFEQGIASDVWVIEHNLNKKPAIEVTDSAGTIITGFKAQYDDLNTVTIYFNGAFTGNAYLN